MYYPGSFVNLLWNADTLNKSHKSVWEDLQARYGFSVRSSFNASQGTRLLYAIADSCVSQCEDLLFSLIPYENIEGGTGSCWYSPNTYSPLPNDIRQRFHDAFCDHLIVSFAFRFFCENLIPGTLYLYSRTLHDCFDIARKNKALGGDWLATDTSKNDFYKVVKRRYEGFCKKIGLQFPASCDGSESEDTTESDSEPIFDVQVAHFVSELGRRDIPPPYAWFLLFYLSGVTGFQNALKDKKNDRLYSLMKWIAQSEYSYTLLDVVQDKNGRYFQTLPDAPSIFDDWDCSFTCIPLLSESEVNAAIPDVKYAFKDSEDPVVITSRLQKVFNNYLFEQNFHIHAMTTAEYYLKQFHCSGRGQHAPIEAIISPVKIHAPFIPSTFISCLSGSFGIREVPLLIEQYIDRWNEIALPVLEELFIWNVWTHMPSRSQVADAINKWISHDATYNRLSIIRIGQADKIVPIRYIGSPTMEKDMKALHNRLIDLIWE